MEFDFISTSLKTSIQYKCMAFNSGWISVQLIRHCMFATHTSFGFFDNHSFAFSDGESAGKENKE